MLYLNIHQPRVRHFLRSIFSKFLLTATYPVILMQQLFNALKPRLHLKEKLNFLSDFL